jgi:hypothetical protein
LAFALRRVVSRPRGVESEPAAASVTVSVALPGGAQKRAAQLAAAASPAAMTVSFLTVAALVALLRRLRRRTRVRF